MGITVQGQLILTQQTEEIKDKDLKMIMDAVNRFDKSVNTISLKLPFYIESQEDRYILKCENCVQSDDEAQIRKWLLFLHRYIFYTSGIVSKGEFVLINDKNDETSHCLCDENGLSYKEENFQQRYLNRKLFIQQLKEDPNDKRFYTQFFELTQ